MRKNMIFFTKPAWHTVSNFITSACRVLMFLSALMYRMDSYASRPISLLVRGRTIRILFSYKLRWKKFLEKNVTLWVVFTTNKSEGKSANSWPEIKRCIKRRQQECHQDNTKFVYMSNIVKQIFWIEKKLKKDTHVTHL